MKKYLIIIIFLIALFLRLYKLGTFPVGFLWDEAAIGYNAYSIIKTGNDEHGQFLPIVFKSFGDFKPGFYIYLTIPSVLLLGLNEFAVRFPSALFGSLTVLILYLVCQESELLFRKDMREKSSSLPLISAILLTLSPWHIMFSRGAWEVNVMVFELLLGLFLFLKFINEKRFSLLIFSLITFLLSLITYQSAKLIMPLLIFGIILFFRKMILNFEKRKLYLVLTSLVFVFLIFNVYSATGGRSGRIKSMSIFSYPRSPEETEMYKSQDKNGIDFAIFHSTPIFFIRSIAGRYFNYFSGKFLFINGDWSNERNGVVYQGVLYYVDILFLFIGLYLLLSKERNALSNLMLFWLVVAPLPAALTRDSISSVRSLTMVIPLIYIISVGLTGVIEFTVKGKLLVKFVVLGTIIFVYTVFFVRFIDLYFVHDKNTSSESRLLGYKEMVLYIKPLISDKNKVVITSFYGQPYIFYLFYSKYDPRSYQQNNNFIDNPYGDVGRVDNLDNIEFRRIYWPKDRSIQNSLFVGNEFDLPVYDVVNQGDKIVLDKEINFFSGKTAFRIVETR